MGEIGKANKCLSKKGERNLLLVIYNLRYDDNIKMYYEETGCEHMIKPEADSFEKINKTHGSVEGGKFLYWVRTTINFSRRNYIMLYRVEFSAQDGCHLGFCPV